MLVVLVPVASRATDQKLPPRQPPFAKGYVQKVELPSKRLLLQTRSGLEMFAWDQRSLFFREGKRITPDQLAPGALVAIRFTAAPNAIPVIQRLKMIIPTPAPTSP